MSQTFGSMLDWHREESIDVTAALDWASRTRSFTLRSMCALQIQKRCAQTPADVTDPGSLAAAVGNLEAELGPIHTVVYNAGSGVWYSYRELFWRISTVRAPPKVKPESFTCRSRVAPLISKVVFMEAHANCEVKQTAVVVWPRVVCTGIRHFRSSSCSGELLRGRHAWIPHVAFKREGGEGLLHTTRNQTT
eukprot:CAMPEP_0196760426 /NCGR_PEP_ID=MMETSP1091-20130531/105211_1 /TAXON_ID=302021 /ORGANISM="Rhodomonas sp., Strain CCMP768" /LENGTH=191 /DNA_ID=CAMNT_0042109311 /DNA_START=470 /DNA_END=1041 /DNA_ORIENTATION=-